MFEKRKGELNGNLNSMLCILEDKANDVSIELLIPINGDEFAEQRFVS